MKSKLWTIRLIFALAGVGISVWAIVVPYAKLKFHLSDGDLGVVLFFAGIGGVLAMPLAGPAVARWGSRNCIVVAGLLICLLLPLFAIAPSAYVFTGLLFLYGAIFGLLDVAMNTQGTVIEARSGRLHMSGFHACYSLGMLSVAVLVSVLLNLGATLELFCFLCAAIVLLGLTQSFRLVPKKNDPQRNKQNFALPNPHALVLGLCCFTAFMCEGASTDWSTVFLNTVRHMPIHDAVLGYAAFAITTTFARLTGDRLAMYFGQSALMRLGVSVAVTGFALVVFVPFGLVNVLGFALVGFGTGNIAPLVFSAASRVPGMYAHHSIPAVVGIGYLGFLIGPVMMGAVSSHFGLAAAFGVNAALLAGSFFAARYVA